MPSPAPPPPPLLMAPSSSPGHGQSSMTTQPSRDVQGDHDDDEAGDHRTMGMERDHAASTSLSAAKSLLLKRKLTGSNVRLSQSRKTSGANMHISPLSRVLLTPRLAIPGARQERSPSLARNISPQGRLSRTPCPSHAYPADTSRTNKRRKLRSEVWKEFEPIYDGHLLVQARCIHCLVVFEDNPWADFEQLLVAQKKNKVKSELDQYLQDDLFPRQKDFDILKWWMMHVTKYPILSRMARDVLAAPASSVASESAFSTGERTISEYRSRLTSKTVEALICLQDWLRAQGRNDINIVDDILEENS